MHDEGPVGHGGHCFGKMQGDVFDTKMDHMALKLKHKQNFEECKREGGCKIMSEAGLSDFYLQGLHGRYHFDRDGQINR